MTAAELRWWKLFKRIVKAMPKSLEVSVHQSSIAVSKAGSRLAAFKRDGHADQTEDLDFFNTPACILTVSRSDIMNRQTAFFIS